MTRLLINSEYRFQQTPDGSVWTETAFPYSYWEKYLASFAEVRILARVGKLAKPSGGLKRVDGLRVSVEPLPYYLGSRQYLIKWLSIYSAMRKAVRPGDAVIIISPSPLSLILEKVTQRLHLRYGVEVLGDPREVFSSLGVRHPLRILLRSWLTHRQKKLVAGASAVSYVTQNSLQKNYPPARNSFSIGVSNIDLERDHIVSAARRVGSQSENSFRIVGVGSLEQLYKGVDVLLDALAVLSKSGYRIKFTWIGGGRFLEQLTDLSRRLGLGESVSFLGQLPAGDAVRYQLDQADLFVLPSRTEGLPRALVEAMARGLPCVGSNVGGIPELLDDGQMFENGDAVAAAKLIEKMILQPAWRKAMAQKNLERSHEYLNERLDEKRQAFLTAVAQSAQPSR